MQSSLKGLSGVRKCSESDYTSLLVEAKMMDGEPFRQLYGASNYHKRAASYRTFHCTVFHFLFIFIWKRSSLDSLGCNLAYLSIIYSIQFLFMFSIEIFRQAKIIAKEFILVQKVIINKSTI